MSEKEFLYCPVRKATVQALPEEHVRQAFITYLLEEIEVPFSTLAVEVPLASFPHLSNSLAQIPPRRADIVVFSSKIHPKYPMFPLLLVECKAAPINDKVRRQVNGYQTVVQVPHVAVVNQSELWWRGPEEVDFKPYLLKYKSLVDIVACKAEGSEG